MAKFAFLRRPTASVCYLLQYSMVLGSEYGVVVDGRVTSGVVRQCCETWPSPGLHHPPIGDQVVEVIHISSVSRGWFLGKQCGRNWDRVPRVCVSVITTRVPVSAVGVTLASAAADSVSISLDRDSRLVNRFWRTISFAHCLLLESKRKLFAKCLTSFELQCNPEGTDKKQHIR